MKHKLHDLLIAAANDSEAMFTCPRLASLYPIDTVIMYSKEKWVLVDKWAKEKQAFKEGKTIEIKDNGNWQVILDPRWCAHNEYRIKPETVTKWLWADTIGGVIFSDKPFERWNTKINGTATECEVHDDN